MIFLAAATPATAPVSSYGDGLAVTLAAVVAIVIVVALGTRPG
ncbi:hypothetical protein [Streptacidiphilus sp. PAMC 29251]